MLADVGRLGLVRAPNTCTWFMGIYGILSITVIESILYIYIFVYLFTYGNRILTDAYYILHIYIYIYVYASKMWPKVGRWGGQIGCFHFLLQHLSMTTFSWCSLPLDLAVGKNQWYWNLVLGQLHPFIYIYIFIFTCLKWNIFHIYRLGFYAIYINFLFIFILIYHI
jgi:hypothetical protein